MSSKYEGATFGQLKVIEVTTHPSKTGRSVAWQAKTLCTCGTERVVDMKALLTGAATACKACVKKKASAEAAMGHQHPLYKTWWSMVLRCHDDKTPHYPGYGGRGIIVCEKWRGARKKGEAYGSIDGFHNFAQDMGVKPSPEHSLGRIDNDGGYTPANCRWETQAQQMANTRNTVYVQHMGERVCVAEWQRRVGTTIAPSSVAKSTGLPVQTVADEIAESPRVDWLALTGRKRKAAEKRPVPKEQIDWLAEFEAAVDAFDL